MGSRGQKNDRAGIVYARKGLRNSMNRWRREWSEMGTHPQKWGHAASDRQRIPDNISCRVACHSLNTGDREVRSTKTGVLLESLNNEFWIRFASGSDGSRSNHSL